MDKKKLVNVFDKLKGLSLSGDSSLWFDDGFIVTWDSEIFLMSFLNCNVQGAVPFTKFLNFIKLCKKDIALLESDDGKHIKVKSGRANSAFWKLDKIECPHDIKSFLKYVRRQKNNWVEVDEDFVNGLHFCFSMLDKDTILPGLLGVYVTGKTMVVSDDLRIGFYKLKSKYPEILIPGNIVQEICRIGGPFKFFIKDGYIVVVFHDDLVLGGLLYSEEVTFPEGWKKHESSKMWKESFWKLLPGLKGSLERMSIFASGETNLDLVVKCENKKGQLLFESSNVFGTALDKSKSVVKKDFEILVNPSFMLHALNNGMNILSYDEFGLYTRSDDNKKLIYMSGIDEG